MSLAFQLPENRVLVVEEIAEELVGEFLVHGDGVTGFGAENAGGKGGGETCNVVLWGGGEVDEAGEVRGEGVKGGNIVETELAEG